MQAGTPTWPTCARQLREPEPCARRWRATRTTWTSTADQEATGPVPGHPQEWERTAIAILPHARTWPLTVQGVITWRGSRKRWGRAVAQYRQGGQLAECSARARSAAQRRALLSPQLLMLFGHWSRRAVAAARHSRWCTICLAWASTCTTTRRGAAVRRAAPHGPVRRVGRWRRCALRAV